MDKSASSPALLQPCDNKEISWSINQYKARGSLFYLSNKTKFYSRFFLRQFSPENYHLLLINLVGIIEVDLKVRSNIVQLIDHNGKIYTSDNAEEMIYKLSGMVIPLNSLRQLIVKPLSRSRDYTQDNRYNCRRLKYQQGNLSWIVDYQHDSGELASQLPSRLELKQDDRRIILKINSWVLE